MASITHNRDRDIDKPNVTAIDLRPALHADPAFSCSVQQRTTWSHHFAESWRPASVAGMCVFRTLTQQGWSGPGDLYQIRSARVTAHPNQINAVDWTGSINERKKKLKEGEIILEKHGR
jgi:hypothetical protein